MPCRGAGKSVFGVSGSRSPGGGIQPVCHRPNRQSRRDQIWYNGPTIRKETQLARFYYGGQAVIEGVMMRGQRHMAVAVRAPDGSITVHGEPLNGALYRHPVMKLPVLRGLVALWDALGLGMRALMYSAEVSLQEET